MESEFETEFENEITGSNLQLKAKKLKSGSRVALVAPASRPEKPSVLKRCVRVLEEMGFQPECGKSILKYDGFSAGSDEERLEDLQGFLENDSVEAIFCVSGGYGALHLLPLLDFAQIRRNPKIFLGSGDNDALLLAINQLSGLVVFHGPNLDEIKDRRSFENLKSVLTNSSEGHSISCSRVDDPVWESAHYPLSEAQVEGIVCGGNLSSLSSLYGTRYQPELEDKILVLDDFSERSSILDRWFTTLYLAGSLKQLAGIAFGEFPGCGSRGSNNMLSIEDTFSDRINEIGVPACFGFKFGGGTDENPLPLGCRADLDCAAGRLTFLESALID